jgi:hypothetical protein
MNHCAITQAATALQKSAVTSIGGRETVRREDMSREK